MPIDPHIPLGALRAFEAAARHCNFSRAAEELHTSQSAISRHIANLESRFDTLLFDRYRKRNLTLSHQGDQLYRAVVSGFDNIQATIDSISGTTSLEQLTVACTHEVSHLYLLPRFDELQQAVGRDRPIRVMTYEYDTMETALDSRIDIVIRYDISRVDPVDRVRIVGEAVQPVAAPAFIEQHGELLRREPAAWESLPFLALSKHNYGWATWQDWFEATGCPQINPEFTYFSNYVYLLEAAAAGRGLALGWRGLIERYVENGVLSGVTGEYIDFDRAIYAVLTARGRSKPLARRFMDCIAHKKSKAG